MANCFGILQLYKPKVTSGFNKEYKWEQIVKAGILLLSLSVIWLTTTLGHFLVWSELLNLLTFLN